MNMNTRAEKEKTKRPHDTHLICKGDAVVSACIAFTNATKLNRSSSENHLNFHLREPIYVFLVRIAATFLQAVTPLAAVTRGQNSEVECWTAKLTQQVSLASMTWNEINMWIDVPLTLSTWGDEKKDIPFTSWIDFINEKKPKW